MKLTALALFGAGYIAGTRAGRERYEQIVAVARRMADRLDERGPTAGSASEFTERLAQRLEGSATRDNGHVAQRPGTEPLEHRA